MSPGISPAVFTPDTDAADKLVISALIPMYRQTIGFQYRIRYYRSLIERFTFVQLLYPLLTDFLLAGFLPFPELFSTNLLKRKHHWVD